MDKIEFGLNYFGELNRRLKSFIESNTVEFDRMKKVFFLNFN